MAFEAEFLSMMPDRITVEPYVSMSTDGYAVRTYGAAKTFAARVEPYGKLTKDSQHKDVVSNTRIFMPATDTAGTTYILNIADRVTMPAAYTATGIHANPPIISVQPVNDEDGLHHQEVLV